MKLLKHKLATLFLWIAFKLDPRFIAHLTTTPPSETADSSAMPESEVHAPEDNLSSEGVGIVMRPTAQELAKMNEDTATREAKEAIAETIRNAEEPKI